MIRIARAKRAEKVPAENGGKGDPLKAPAHGGDDGRADHAPGKMSTTTSASHNTTNTTVFRTPLGGTTGHPVNGQRDDGAELLRLVSGNTKGMGGTGANFGSNLGPGGRRVESSISFPSRKFVPAASECTGAEGAWGDCDYRAPSTRGASAAGVDYGVRRWRGHRCSWSINQILGIEGQCTSSD